MAYRNGEPSLIPLIECFQISFPERITWHSKLFLAVELYKRAVNENFQAVRPYSNSQFFDYYIHTYIYTYTQTDVTKCIILLCIRAQGNYGLMVAWPIRRDDLKTRWWLQSMYQHLFSIIIAGKEMLPSKSTLEQLIEPALVVAMLYYLSGKPQMVENQNCPSSFFLLLSSNSLAL